MTQAFRYNAGTMPPAVQGSLSPRNLEIRDNFDAIAGRYDLTNRVISAGMDLRWRRRAVALLRDLAPASAVLDLACGTGDMTRALLRQNGALRVTGVDLSRNMLALAQKALGRAPLVNAPAEALPFADGAFDGAMIAFGIRNVPDYRAGLREMARVLKSGGRAVVLEFSTPPSRLLWRLYNSYFFHVLPRIGGWLTGREQAYRYLTRSVSEFPGAAEFAQAMRDAGFARVSWQSLQGGIVCIHSGWRP